MTTQSRVWRRDMHAPLQIEQKRRWLLSGNGRASAAGAVFRSLAMLALFNSLLLLLLLPQPKLGSSFVIPSSFHVLPVGRSRGPYHRGARSTAVNPHVPLNRRRQPPDVCDHSSLEARRALLVTCSANNNQDEGGGVAGGLVGSAVPETEVND